MSGSSSEAVSMITGTRLVRSSWRIRSSSSRPFMRGILKSSRISLGGTSEESSPNRYSTASTPSRQTCTTLAKWCFWKAWSASSTSSGLSSTRRTSTCFSNFGIKALQSEMECRAKVGLGSGPDLASVAMDDALDGCQLDAGALVVLDSMKALKDTEKTTCVAHVETGSVVLDEI